MLVGWVQKVEKKQLLICSKSIDFIGLFEFYNRLYTYFAKEVPTWNKGF